MLHPQRIVAGALLALAVPSFASSAHAQAFNIDVGDNTILFPAPSSAYDAAAAQPGFWNAVKTPYSAVLAGLDGSPSSATCASSGPNAFATIFSGLSGDDEAFMADCQHVNQFSGTIHWTFSGLADGSYRVYTYAWDPGISAVQTAVTVIGSPDPTQNVGGLWSGSPHVPGTTYAEHRVTVSGGTILVDVAGVGGSGSVNGFQIVPETALTTFCSGDGSLSVACPCGNTGAIGRGCANSAVAVGAHLVASGMTQPDSVVLTASDELPTATSVFLQGNTTIPNGVVFGDGVRCVGGNLKRIAVRTASGGSASYPGPGDPSISAQSAALGDPIAPGSVRWYQVYYRDANLAFCPAPPGNSWNVTNGIQVLW